MVYPEVARFHVRLEGGLPFPTLRQRRDVASVPHASLDSLARKVPRLGVGEFTEFGTLIKSPRTPLRDRQLSLGAYLSSWWKEIVQWDGPTRGSVRTLLHSPGELSVQHLDQDLQGPHHVHPIRLYLLINLLFFLLAPWVNSSNISVWRVQHQGILQLQPALQGMVDRAIADSGAEDPNLFLAVLDERLSAQQGALVWMLIPVLGLASFAVARRRRQYLVEHLVFATNLVSYFLVSLMAVGLSGRLVVALVGDNARWLLLVLVPILGWIGWVWVAVYRSAKSFHGFERRTTTALFTIWLGLALHLGVWLYLQALLVVTLFGLRDLSLSVAGLG